MQVKSFALSIGAGMALGAAVIMMLPQQNKVRKAVEKTANRIEDSIEDTMCCMKHS